MTMRSRENPVSSTRASCRRVCSWIGAHTSHSVSLHRATAFIGSSGERFRDLAVHEIPSHFELFLCPAGWARWSFRLTESILHHAIPVILSDGYLLPLSRHLDWDRLAVRVPESELSRVLDVVRAISPERRRGYREHLAANAFRFTPAGMLEILAREIAARVGAIGAPSDRSG